MKLVVKPLPVLYACAGCPEFGYAAPRVAQRLDAEGRAEAIWLGAHPAPATLTSRYPVFTLDACSKGCARKWVEARGGSVDREFELVPPERDDPERAAARIAALL